jgi:bifunctional ADP-heptose synthase (sugar kinase/adenylyltransferase)
LDTRTKIIPLSVLPERLRDRPFNRVAGHFDPLLAEHVQRLAAAREPGRLLVVEVTNSQHPLLTQRARAELVAALSIVDFVVLGEAETALDAGITERFTEHVLHRHSQESTR